MVNALEPVKAATESLSANNVNLMTCEITLQFVLDELSSQSTSIGHGLYEAIKNRISQRRNKKMVSLLYYLSHEKPLTSNNHSVLTYSNKKEIRATVVKVYNRLFPNDPSLPSSSSDIDVSVVETKDLSVKERLLARINKRKSNESGVGPGMPSLNKEMDTFDKTGVLSIRLKKLRDAVLTIKPTSTESERIFSTSGHFVSCKRTRLSDDSINAIVFNKYYFHNQV